MISRPAAEQISLAIGVSAYRSTYLLSLSLSPSLSLSLSIGSCRRANTIIGVPWYLRRLSLFSTCLHDVFDKQSTPG